MTSEQRHVIEKMSTIHKVRIYGETAKGALIVFSHNESGKVYLSYSVGAKGSANLLSTIKESPWVNEQFKKMEALNENA